MKKIAVGNTQKCLDLGPSFVTSRNVHPIKVPLFEKQSLGLQSEDDLGD